MIEVTGGGKPWKTWIKYTYEGIGLPEFISWEDFKKKEYFVFFPGSLKLEKDPPGFRRFYENPVKYPLDILR